VDSTGAIKSILADLILSVLDPDLARDLVGGVTTREAILRWPGAISYVPQNVTLTIKSVQKTSPWGYPVNLSMTGR
jgi:ABC-type multidrug transport system fused ATPase/permease subunit